MDTCRTITRRLALAGWTGLGLLLQAQAGALPGPDADARFLLQGNDEHIRSQIESLRLRQLHRGEAVRSPDAPGPTAVVADCLPIHALRLDGITLLHRQELATLNIPRTDCLNGAELQRIVHDLTALYLARGFIAARVLPEVGRDGVMTLYVVEGYVDRIEGLEHGVPALFPGMVGHPLNLRDLEQGLDQANRLQSEHLRAEVLPGAQPGASTLRFLDQITSPWHGGVSLDNRGYDSTGRRMTGVTLARDNPGGNFDFFSLSLEHSLSHARYSRRGSLFYSLPYGYWTFSTFAGLSEYLNTQKLRIHTVELSGSAAQGGVRAERVLARDQRQISSAYLQLSHTRVQNHFMGSLQDISSPTLTVLESGGQRISLLPAGVLSLEAVIEKGLPWFGARQDWRAPAPWLPRAQFTKARFSAGLRQGLSPGAVPLTLDSRVNWQGSRQSLPAIGQIELADSSMVRGFRHNSLAGATGWVWHNTLSLPLQLNDLNVIPRLALDIGRVQAGVANQNYSSLAGGGAGLSLSQAGVTLDLEYSRPLYQPDWFAGEAHQVLARLSWQF